MKNEQVITENANGLLRPYLELKDEQYLLNLTLEKAIQLGVFKTDYEQAIGEIKEINSAILKLKEDPNTEISLSDPQKLINKGVMQTMPRGSLKTNGTEQVSDSFDAPSATTKVRFLCSGGGAVFPAYFCVTVAQGITKSKTEIGSAFTWTEIDVPVWSI